jgi:hypothetical protein
VSHDTADSGGVYSVRSGACSIRFAGAGAPAASYRFRFLWVWTDQVGSTTYDYVQIDSGGGSPWTFGNRDGSMGYSASPWGVWRGGYRDFNDGAFTSPATTAIYVTFRQDSNNNALATHSRYGFKIAVCYEGYTMTNEAMPRCLYACGPGTQARWTHSSGATYVCDACPAGRYQSSSGAAATGNQCLPYVLPRQRSSSVHCFVGMVLL